MMFALELRHFIHAALYWPNSNFNFVTKNDFMTIEKRNLNDS